MATVGTTRITTYRDMKWLVSFSERVQAPNSNYSAPVFLNHPLLFLSLTFIRPLLNFYLVQCQYLFETSSLITFSLYIGKDLIIMLLVVLLPYVYRIVLHLIKNTLVQSLIKLNVNLILSLCKTVPAERYKNKRFYW